MSGYRMGDPGIRIIHTLVNLPVVRGMAMEFSNTQMVLCMMENGRRE